MPVRNIPKTYRSLSGRHFTNKSTGSVGFESSLERDLYTLLEFDENVASFEEQPLTLEYSDAGNHHRTYTPDVLIIYRNEAVSLTKTTHVLGEVKYRADLFLHWKELKPKFKAARAFARRRGWQFTIFTEIEIRNDYLKNVQFLLSYRRLSVEPETSQVILETLANHQSLTPNEILTACAMNETDKFELLPVLWHLVAMQTVKADLNAPLNMNTHLWIEANAHGKQ